MSFTIYHSEFQYSSFHLCCILCWHPKAFLQLKVLVFQRLCCLLILFLNVSGISRHLLTVSFTANTRWMFLPVEESTCLIFFTTNMLCAILWRWAVNVLFFSFDGQISENHPMGLEWGGRECESFFALCTCSWFSLLKDLRFAYAGKAFLLGFHLIDEQSLIQALR